MTAKTKVPLFAGGLPALMRKAPGLIFCAFLLGGVPAPAQTNPVVNMQLYPGLTISGSVGSSYTVQYVTALSDTNNWQTLTNLVLAVSPSLWVDTNSTAAADRFYRVIPTSATNATAPVGMALIPAGPFLMGDTLDSEADAPTNTEYISAFYMDTNLVTYALWQQVYQWAITNGYAFDNVGAGKATNQPVQTINWYDTVKWCNARSQLNKVPPVYFTDAGLTHVYMTGDAAPYANWTAAGYCLPTEAEWEKAGRGGLAGYRFPSANTISESQANYYGDPLDYPYDIGPGGYNPLFGNGIGVDTSPVGYFAPNGYGLNDMAGNVYEWCWDFYGPYVNGVQTDPHGPSAGSFHVLRGGSWLISAFNCRVAGRSYYYTGLGGNGYGFRTVLAPGLH